jgi:hypothetical protein
VAAPPPDATFSICPDGHTGVATSVTSCEFALNVHTSYLNQGGPTVIAYSPVTPYVIPTLIIGALSVGDAEQV